MELTQLCWYVKAEDFDELGNLDLSIKAGRLRHRWVPKSKSAAVRYLTQSPEAEGLRAAADDYLIVNIILAEPIKDLSADYPNAVIPGAHGAVIRVPFEHTLQVAPKDWQIEEGMEPQPSLTDWATSQ